MNFQPNCYVIFHLLPLSYWLTCLINSHSAGKYISVFKVAKVTPIFKYGNAQLVSNYRPISVLSAFSKILEKLVHKGILSFLNQNNISSQLQFGFRPTFSTRLACSYLFSKITDLFNDNNLVLAFFLDLTKAFDTLDHDILLTKLSNYGFRGVVNDWFHSYFNDRQQKVRIKDKYSDIKPISNEVPQGSTFGPLLFLIYINDVFQDIDYETILYAMMQQFLYILSQYLTCSLLLTNPLNLFTITFLLTN